jgi:anti-sigma factor RsiW
MTINDDEVDLSALADGILSGPEWDAWLAAHPRAAAEVAIARRVRALIAQLRAADIVVPADFEARVLAQVRANTTLLDVLDLSLAGVGRALLEILDIFFRVLPESRVAAG